MSRLEEALAAGRFVVTSELQAVDSGGLDAVRERFAPFEDYVDATNATDNTSAHAHASPLAVAIALRQLGMEPVMQLTCRDRNRLALEAELTGAALHGIENVLCLTGDDVTAGDEPEARRVFDLDSIQLLALGATLARGTYLSGRLERISDPSAFTGCDALPRKLTIARMRSSPASRIQDSRPFPRSSVRWLPVCSASLPARSCASRRYSDSAESGSAAWRATHSSSASAISGSHGTPVVKPAPGPASDGGSHGIGARSGSRPSTSTIRSAGISASGRPSSSPW